MKSIYLLLFLVFFAFTQKESPIIFEHRIHQDAGIECVTCHKDAEMSETQKDNLLPGHSECGMCHNVEKEQECGTCHKDPLNPEPLTIITAFLKEFSHKNHQERKVSCEQCHLNKETIEISLPGFKDCLSCHNNKDAKKECSICHRGNENYLSDYHGIDYRFSHRKDGKNEFENCLLCHELTENFRISSVQIPSCQGCHYEENITFTNHPENFIYTHSFQAKSRAFECQDCHQNFSSCVQCHKERGIYPMSHNDLNWANQTDGGGHSSIAKIDPEYCASCHQEKQPICINCHQGGTR